MRMFSPWPRLAVPACCSQTIGELARDFRSKVLIDNPRGRVYHTRDVNACNDNKRVSQTHRRLLNDRRLCRASA